MAVATSTALLASAGAGLAGAALDARSRGKATESAERQKRESQEFIKRQIDRARGDLFQLFPEAQESRQKGIQAGLDLIEQTFPARVRSFRQGNIMAQDQIARGLPQMQNAILGNQVDMSQFQPQMVDGGIGSLQMPQAPQFAPIQQGGPQGNPQGGRGIESLYMIPPEMQGRF